MSTDHTEALRLGVSQASEMFVPGGSNFLRGDLLVGAGHLIAGYAARSLFGMPGLALVTANSLVRATTGLNLTEHIGLTKPRVLAEAEAAPIEAEGTRSKRGG